MGMKLDALTQDCSVFFTKAFWSINEQEAVKVGCTPCSNTRAQAHTLTYDTHAQSHVHTRTYRMHVVGKVGVSQTLYFFNLNLAIWPLDRNNDVTTMM